MFMPYEIHDVIIVSAGYIQRAKDILPKQGARRPWRLYQNYVMDALVTRFGKVDDGVLAFGRTGREGKAGVHTND